jgi:hypothetical protein
MIDGAQGVGTIRVKCPHCNRPTHAKWWLPDNRYAFSYYGDQPHWSRNRYGDIYAAGSRPHALQCDTTYCPENGCRGPITIVLLWASDVDELRKTLKDGWHVTPDDTRLAKLLEVLPSSAISARTLQTVPDKVQQEFPAIAELAAEGRAPATAAAGCGSCLEEALKALETRAASEGWLSTPVKANARLVERIDALVTAGVITRDIGQWSHQVRLLRNHGTHELKADAEAVRELVAFLQFFFEAAFALPARLKELKNVGQTKAGP